MAGKVVEPRAVSPIIQYIRNFLQGRESINALRFQDGLAARTQPPPNIPEGPAHKLAVNYYYDRDGRREVKPPALLASNETAAKIEAGEKETGPSDIRKAVPTPGKVWMWD